MTPLRTVTPYERRERARSRRVQLAAAVLAVVTLIVLECGPARSAFADDWPTEVERVVPPARAGRFASRVMVAADAVAWAFPESEQRRAFLVADCESRFNPEARNPRSSAVGLFQVIPEYHREIVRNRDLTDPYANAAVAAEIVAVQGWTPWAASRGCWG